MRASECAFFLHTEQQASGKEGGETKEELVYVFKEHGSTWWDQLLFVWMCGREKERDRVLHCPHCPVSPLPDNGLSVGWLQPACHPHPTSGHARDSCSSYTHTEKEREREKGGAWESAEKDEARRQEREGKRSTNQAGKRPRGETQNLNQNGNPDRKNMNYTGLVLHHGCC